MRRVSASSLSTIRPPTADEQVAFLRNVQDLLSEGQFTATYKFAVLLALSRIAIEQGDDGGAPLRVSTRAIAEHLIRLYWHQVAPYPSPVDAGSGSVLSQITNQSAVILSQIEAERAAFDGSLSAFEADGRRHRKLARSIEHTVHRYPLKLLQWIGRREHPFLYDYDPGRREIVLHPGVAFCLRRYHALVRDLVETAWIRFVRGIPRNRSLLGERIDLGEFLFGASRGSLSTHREILRELQGGRCFYCDRNAGTDAEVDHFIPWSRHPSDLGHNLVLADAGCNSRKSDHLAALQHLARWCDRNDRFGIELAERFDSKSLPHDLTASQRIARWAYGQAEHAGGLLWRTGQRADSPLDASWRVLLSAPPPAP